MKKILSYILLFICTVMVLFIALVVSSKIPHSAIEKNLKESTKLYRKTAGIYRIKENHRYSHIHYFADVRKLNIIYCLDSEKPIESSLWARYYQIIKRDTNVEKERIARNRTTEITGDKMYVVALTNEEKVVIAKCLKEKAGV